MSTAAKPASTTLDDERVLPGVTDQATYLSHLARYQFALRWISPEHDVLETACGTGYGTRLVAERARSVLATDYSDVAVQHARQQYPACNLQFAIMDCHRLALRDARFDVVLSLEVFEHLEDPQAYLRECSRVLRPGGCLLLSTPNRATWDVHMASIRQEYAFHINMVDLDGLWRALKPLFPASEIFGQRSRGNWLYSMLRSLDRWNLRLRLFAPATRQKLREQMGVPAAEPTKPEAWGFYQSQLRQCNHFLAVCRK